MLLQGAASWMKAISQVDRDKVERQGRLSLIRGCQVIEYGRSEGRGERWWRDGSHKRWGCRINQLRVTSANVPRRILFWKNLPSTSPGFLILWVWKNESSSLLEQCTYIYIYVHISLYTSPYVHVHINPPSAPSHPNTRVDRCYCFRKIWIPTKGLLTFLKFARVFFIIKINIFFIMES